ncbi:hypothetical protein [Novosphingobium sp. YAF33]|uniref:hypothetical protein n=1 Tax=Novosphingobium sp. YAF33 TaxID=3233082 RepID=UPI003F94DA15
MDDGDRAQPRRHQNCRLYHRHGPEGRVRQVIAEGTPEDIVKVKASFTGHYLKPLLSNWAK